MKKMMSMLGPEEKKKYADLFVSDQCLWEKFKSIESGISMRKNKSEKYPEVPLLYYEVVEFLKNISIEVDNFDIASLIIELRGRARTELNI